jgi:hypothetical protein
VVSTKLWHTQFLYPRWGKLGGDNLGKLRGGMWLQGANQLVLWEFYNEKIVQQQFIVHATTLETWHNHIGIKVGFDWQMTHIEFANDVVHLHNIEQ